MAGQAGSRTGHERARVLLMCSSSTLGLSLPSSRFHEKGPRRFAGICSCESMPLTHSSSWFFQ